MSVHLHAQRFQLFLVGDGTGLSRKLGEAHTAYIEAIAAECINQSEHVQIIGDAQIGAHLIFLDVCGVDNNYNFRLVLELYQHVNLAVRLKAG